METKADRVVEAEYNFSPSRLAPISSARRLKPEISVAIMSIYRGGDAGSDKRS
jgi:hypothetical protein